MLTKGIKVANRVQFSPLAFDWAVAIWAGSRGTRAETETRVRNRWLAFEMVTNSTELCLTLQIFVLRLVNSNDTSQGFRTLTERVEQGPRVG